MSLSSLTTRPRCVVVAAVVTTGEWGAGAALVRSVATAPAPRSPAEALVGVCTAALVLALAWWWLQSVAGVADAWRGAAPARPGLVRRVATAACGVALLGGVAAPAARAADPHGPGGPGGPDVLSGLPLPERAESASRSTGRTPDATQGSAQVVVRAGDCLWTIAARDLGPRATPGEIAERWHDVYAANRAVIGPDPDLLLPGQVLTVPEEEK